MSWSVLPFAAVLAVAIGAGTDGLMMALFPRRFLALWADRVLAGEAATRRLGFGMLALATLILLALGTWFAL